MTAILVITNTTNLDKDFYKKNYKVVLHNDNYTPYFVVIEALVNVVNKLSVEEATQIMLEAHNNGKALIIICDLETAEFYAEELAKRGLTISVEQVD